VIIPIALLLVFGWAPPAIAQTTITAYKSQQPVSLDGVVQASEWNDTQALHDPTSGMTVSFKQNGTGLLALLVWPESSQCQTCYAAIEFGPMNNSGHMGSPLTPTIMVIVSPSFKGGIDEYIATSEQAPTPVEEFSYRTQSTGSLGYSNGVYSAEIYRPFHVSGASPYELNFTVGSTIEIGFAVGDFGAPGSHSATDMSTYVLTISNSLFTPTALTTTASSGATNVAGTTNVSYYSIELALIIVGYLVFLVVATRGRRK